MTDLTEDQKIRNAAWYRLGEVVDALQALEEPKLRAVVDEIRQSLFVDGPHHSYTFPLGSTPEQMLKAINERQIELGLVKKPDQKLILWARAAALGTPNDQRVEFIEVVGGNLRVRMCGNDEMALISPTETCGLEFNDNVSIKYKPLIIERHEYK